jgi:single-strand DNA-binding protein
MKCLNKVQLIGYLGKDPEIKEFASGNVLAIFRLATDRFFKPEDGNTTKRTDWHTAKLWGKGPISKFCSNLMKGSHILIEGQLVYESVRSKTGNTYQKAEVKAYLVIDLDR